VLISPEHFELNQKYQKLLLKNMQLEKLIEKKDEEYKLLLSKITPLQKFVEDLTEKYKEVQTLYEEALKVIREKDKQIQRLELIEHQY
jgi:transposase